MKIDPRVQLTGGMQADQTKNAKKATVPFSDTKSDAVNSANSEDTIQISSRHAEVQQLTQQAANVPEVRSERVAPLKAAVQEKSYNPDSGKVADAMLAEHARKSARA